MIVPVIELGEALVALKDGIFPVPLAPRPMAVLELIHANVVRSSHIRNNRVCGKIRSCKINKSI